MVLATDGNPGTSPIFSLPLIVGLGVRRYGLSTREALLAVTLNAAWVLDLSDELGSIELDKRADLVLLDSRPSTSLTGSAATPSRRRSSAASPHTCARTRRGGSPSGE